MILNLQFSSMRLCIFRLTILVLFIFLPDITFAQRTVTNTFSYGNSIFTDISLFSCESTLNLNVLWTNAQENDTLILFIPNSFEILGLPSNFLVTANTGQFVRFEIPIFSVSGNASLQFVLKNCLNAYADASSQLNTNNLQFQSYLINPNQLDVVLYNYNSQNMFLYGGTPGYVEFSRSSTDLKQMNISQGIYLVEFKNRSTNQTFRTRFVYGN